MTVTYSTAQRDQALHESIGWLVGSLGRVRLEHEIERAETGEDTERIAAQLREWLRLTYERDPRDQALAGDLLPDLPVERMGAAGLLALADSIGDAEVSVVSSRAVWPLVLLAKETR